MVVFKFFSDKKMRANNSKYHVPENKMDEYFVRIRNMEIKK